MPKGCPFECGALGVERGEIPWGLRLLAGLFFGGTNASETNCPPITKIPLICFPCPRGHHAVAPRCPHRIQEIAAIATNGTEIGQIERLK
jgi:hypothetical protein